IVLRRRDRLLLALLVWRGSSRLRHVFPEPATELPLFLRTGCTQRRYANRSRRCRPSYPPARRAICECAALAVPHRPTVAQASLRSNPPCPDATSTIASSRDRMPATVTKGVSQMRLAHDFRRAHGFALSRRELLTSLCYRRCHSRSTALREATAQYSHQFQLRLSVELFGCVKDIIKCVLLAHGNLVSIILPSSS